MMTLFPKTLLVWLALVGSAYALDQNVNLDNTLTARSSAVHSVVSEEIHTADNTVKPTAALNALGQEQEQEQQQQQQQQRPIKTASKVQHDMTPMGMYRAADWVVKSVMILLLLASVLSWALFVSKQIQVSLACKHAARLLRELIASENLKEGKQRSFDKKGGGLALIDSALHELELSAMGAASNDGIKERVQISLERTQASLNSKMTSGTGILATIGSVGPFVGLFGTVWGIMNAFIGIAKTQSTTLDVVAPGIAEALLATAIGLVAAIPAVIMYNHFTRAIGRYRAYLADINAALLVLVSRDLDRKPNTLGKAG
ncbi:tonB-system energizer ExbB [Vibrio tapetis subsp. quintayensis]|uniref:tonB-system energizer ExbB n=1 Tax=Vibrio tapetis TaxID=52443 RepID=UPI0025B2C7E9|nr:tonB-system energizer ExbB [Vibrio tapetis]MDN3681205.1 tonB-system energizer ExbB [Vibrio tapetis subsp. quintayensis]